MTNSMAFRTSVHGNGRASGGLWLLLLLSLIVINTGCASYFTRKTCESTNWFQYGEKVAGEGRRLSGDGFINECRKVEANINEAQLDQGFKHGMANYCKVESVYDLGKRGEFFSQDMCDGENLRKLLERHKAGVNDYCQKSNGFTAGSTGKTYNRICPKELETAFLPEFNRGRKRYLGTLANENEKRIIEIDREIIGLERDRNMKQLEMQRLSMPTGLAVERKYDPVSGSYREQVINQISEDQKRAIEDMRWKIQSLDSQISQKRTEQSNLREEIRKINLEISGLDGAG